MLGAVAGDIIGSPYEWNNTNDRFFELCRGTRGWFRGRDITYHRSVVSIISICLFVINQSYLPKMSCKNSDYISLLLII